MQTLPSRKGQARNTARVARATPPQPDRATDASASQAFAHHFEDVAGQLARCQDALQLGLHQLLASTVVLGPACQRCQQARGDLRVEGIEDDYLIGEEAVA